MITLNKNKSVTIERESVGLILLAILAVGFVLGVKHVPNAIVPYPADVSISERTKATDYEKKANKKLAIHYAKVGFGYSKNETKCLVTLWTLESRFDNFARPRYANGKLRSTAFGIAQHLGERSANSGTQILRGLSYIEEHRRYKGSA